MHDLSGKYVDVQGCRVYVETAGRGLPILFLAPAGREGSHWQAYLAHFGRTHHAIAVDLPGRGKSSVHPSDRYLRSVDAVVEFLGAFLASIRIDTLAVVGCSYGGNLAYALGCAFPARIKALVSMEGADYTPTIGAHALALLGHPRVNHVEYLTDNVLSLTGAAAADSVREFLVDSLANVNAHALRGDLAGYGGTDLRGRMANVTAPVLSIRGRDDWLVSQQQIDATLSRLTNAARVEHHELEGVGHWPHLEAPHIVIPIVQDFLDRTYT